MKNNKYYRVYAEINLDAIVKNVDNLMALTKEIASFLWNKLLLLSPMLISLTLFLFAYLHRCGKVRTAGVST